MAEDNLASEMVGSAAPCSAEELRRLLIELRNRYAPYLRSLPQAFNLRRQKDLSGTWRFRFEVEDFQAVERPAAPDWHRPDLDDSDWAETTVPEWRYDKPQPPGTPVTPKARRPDSRIVWYRLSFKSPTPASAHRVFLAFAGATWEAHIWLNGVKLGEHTAYWEPFRFDVTDLLRQRNVLAVRLLSGPAFGEPYNGWSLFPMVLAGEPRYVRDASQSVRGQRELFGFNGGSFMSGFGIPREVFLETTGRDVVSELLVRADPAAAQATVTVDVDSGRDEDLVFEIEILPENFEGRVYGHIETRPVRCGPGTQTFAVPMPDARLWWPDDPCLYRCRVKLRDESGAIDSQDALFGCRSFRLATDQDAAAGLPLGMFLLNERPIFLRGVVNSAALNAFWYWRQDDKLLNAILMMKAGGFNAIRSSGHIQFPELRELLDRLGILSAQEIARTGHCTVPPAELAGLCARLARQCYNNPGVILLTTALECTFDPSEIVAAVLAVDPQRVLKPITGNRVDWSYGLPPGYPSMPPEYWDRVVDDFHCYSGWYMRGKAISGISVIYPPGRMVTCSEFGAEALDSYATMQRYPSYLQPPPECGSDLWGHCQVKKGDPKMTIGLRGRTPATLGQYIEASQIYQADILAEQATGLRLSTSRIAGYFAFHYVDGLPAWWPKSIVSFDLTPKRGYFAMAQVNQPVVPLFQFLDEGRKLALWVANDRTAAIAGARLAWRIEAAGRVLLQGECRVDAQPITATAAAAIDLPTAVQETPVVTVSLALSTSDGRPVARYRREVFLKAWRPPDYPITPPARTVVPRLSVAADGDPLRVDWSRAAPLDNWRQVDGPPTQRRIEARIAHDGSFLYVKLIDRSIGPHLDSDDGIWAGEDWEVFIAGQRGRPYRQIGVNPKGAVREVVVGDGLPPCDTRVISVVDVNQWTVFLILPLTAIVPGGLRSGSVSYGNFYRNAGSGDVYREMLAWSPNFGPDFHVPERFGELMLG